MFVDTLSVWKLPPWEDAPFETFSRRSMLRIWDFFLRLFHNNMGSGTISTDFELLPSNAVGYYDAKHLDYVPNWSWASVLRGIPVCTNKSRWVALVSDHSWNTWFNLEETNRTLPFHCRVFGPSDHTSPKGWFSISIVLTARKHSPTVN